jgi:hypothetical protein
MQNSPQPEKPSLNCGKGCIAALIAIVALLMLIVIFYEPTPSAGDMCKIYG